MSLVLSINTPRAEDAPQPGRLVGVCQASVRLLLRNSHYVRLLPLTHEPIWCNQYSPKLADCTLRSHPKESVTPVPTEPGYDHLERGSPGPDVRVRGPTRSSRAANPPNEPRASPCFDPVLWSAQSRSGTRTLPTHIPPIVSRIPPPLPNTNLDVEGPAAQGCVGEVYTVQSNPLNGVSVIC